MKAVLRREILRGRCRRRTSSSCSTDTSASTPGRGKPSCGSSHPTSNFTLRARIPTPRVHRGIDAVRAQYARWVAAYPDLTVEPLEARDAGEKVFLWVRFSGHGEGSGAPVEMELAHVLTMRDGKVARTEEFFDRAEGLEAAGLSDCR